MDTEGSFTTEPDIGVFGSIRSKLLRVGRLSASEGGRNLFEPLSELEI